MNWSHESLKRLLIANQRSSAVTINDDIACTFWLFYSARTCNPELLRTLWTTKCLLSLLHVIFYGMMFRCADTYVIKAAQPGVEFIENYRRVLIKTYVPCSFSTLPVDSTPSGAWAVLALAGATNLRELFGRAEMARDIRRSERYRASENDVFECVLETTVAIVTPILKRRRGYTSTPKNGLCLAGEWRVRGKYFHKRVESAHHELRWSRF